MWINWKTWMKVSFSLIMRNGSIWSIMISFMDLKIFFLGWLKFVNNSFFASEWRWRNYSDIYIHYIICYGVVLIVSNTIHSTIYIRLILSYKYMYVTKLNLNLLFTNVWSNAEGNSQHRSECFLDYDQWKEYMDDPSFF